MNKMKTMALSLALTLIVAAAPAAALSPAHVDALAIGCIFNPGCTNVVEESSSPLTLPGTVGTGFLHTRVILGESNAPAAGLFGYEYRIDLSGVTLDPAVPPCFTNVVRCLTNRVVVTLTNVVVCRTNIVGAANLLNCVTNRIPGTNMVFCVTNSFPATNLVQCFTVAGGAVVCFTNRFPASTNVLCFTNRVPDQSIVSCQTNRLTGSTVVTCATNNTRYLTNLVTCVTNALPCPESSPCVKTVRIDFGPVVAPLDFDANGKCSNQVYVVTTGGSGTAAPSEIAWGDGKLVLTFSPPLCPGDSSFVVGLVSRGSPRDVTAKLKLSNGTNVGALVRAPKAVRPIDCDFSKLAEEIQELRLRDILAPNDQAREGHRTALLNHVQAASAAAEAGGIDDVLAALAAIVDKTDGGRNDWLNAAAARKVNKIMADISKCLVEDGDHDDDGEDDGDDDDQGR